MDLYLHVDHIFSIDEGACKLTGKYCNERDAISIGRIIKKAIRDNCSFTAVKQFRPSETTAVPVSKLLIDHFASSLLLNLDTTFNFIQEGFSSLFSTAATKGVLFSEPRIPC